MPCVVRGTYKSPPGVDRASPLDPRPLGFHELCWQLDRTCQLTNPVDFSRQNRLHSPLDRTFLRHV